MRVAHSVTVSRAALDDGGHPAAWAIWQDVTDGLTRQCLRDGVEPPRDVDVRIDWDTDEARAARQANADAQADAEGIERWTVPEIVTFHMEGESP